MSSKLAKRLNLNIFSFFLFLSLTVYAQTAVTGVSLDLPTATITEGLTQQLTETVAPIDATDQSVAWSSDNLAVATVDASGLVTAVAVGTATITVTTTDGSFTATSIITVEAVPIAVTGVSLDLTTATITEGLTQQLTETIAPIDATDQSVAWSSDNNLIATVDASGLVTAVAVGTATITVTTTDGSFTATSVITVEAAPIAVTGVSLDLTTATITEGLTQQLTETITPIDATDQSVAWSSDNNLIATVDASGLVTAVAVGTATITVTTTDGSFTATSIITVEAAPIAVTGVSLDLPTATITEGLTQQLTETITPIDATDQSVAWSSDNLAVATVDASGLVTAVAVGTATITVTTTDGSFTATSIITVEAAPIAVTGVSLDLPTATITEGLTQQLTETIAPIDATDQSVAWSSDNNLIATVDANGLVTAVAVGTATITVTTTDGSFTATSIITVEAAPIAVTGVSLDLTTATITEGLTQQLTETITPIDATDQSVAWSSDNNLIATVDASGLVTAVAVGTATITVTTTDGSFTATSIITVEAVPIAVTGVSLDLPTATITEGLTQQLTETITPIDATDQSVAWSSDNNLIATVDASGLVTAVAVGTATITVTTTDGSFTATSIITVEAAPIAVTGVSLDLTTATITEGLTQQLTETITPIDATDQSVAWSSDNNLIATVDASGLVTAVAVGTATITVTTTDGSFTATSIITVEAVPIAVTGVSLDLPTATITEGLTQQLTETITPIDATDQSVAWSSDNNLIATVDASGLVTAVAVGTATITVTTTDGSFTATSIITVEAAPIAVTGVSLDLTTATITEGLTQQLTETIAPIDATDQSVAWSSDNNLIATVDASGLVTAVAVGTATITVTTTDGSFTATSIITVEAVPIAVTGVSLDLPTATITEGLTQQLTETITPIDATDQSVAWSSDNNLIATVDASGLVTAVAVGTATITVTTTDGSFTATSIITVEAAPIAVTGVSLDLTTATITEGLTQQLTETITPIDATDQSVAWSSDNNLIATVDASGLVTAVAVGTATITVTTTDGSFTATSIITVEAAPIAVTGVSLDLPTATITEGLTQQLTETITPIDATDQSVAWSSDNNLIATVDASGLVTAVAVGTATITVTTTDGSFTATSIITVEAAPIAVTGVSLDLPAATITEGLTQQLTETIAPIDATDQSVAWSSDNNLIATVDASGLVTAVAVGTATITVTTTDGSFTATSVITVEAAPIAVTGVSLDLTTATITEGLTQQLTETVAPIDATDQSVAWSSDNLAVATVDASGLVTAVAVGTATITVTTTDGSFTATSVITVEAAPILVTGVSLDLTTATITEGLTQQLTETITPIDATDQSVAWSSDNLAVATVDANGLVTAVAVGTATITVTTTDGSFTATSAITVEAAAISVTGVSLDLTTATITEGLTQQLTETIAPIDATDQSVAWSSDNLAVATVDANGLVTAVAVGTATITVTTTDGSFTATSAVTVEAVPIAVTGVSLDLTTATITEGLTQQLTETIAPIDATDQSVAWSSDNNLIATVDASGLVTAVAVGTATITVTTTDGSFTATSIITVEAAPIAVTGVSLDLPTATITEGLTQQLTETITPIDATDQSVAWSSDNNLIATVDASGLVTAVAVGTATITVTTTDGSFTATSIITVEAAAISVTGVSLDLTTATITEGLTQQLTETITPIDATDQSVAWSSDNLAVATVDANGLVTAVAVGTATITVTTTDGSFTATSVITVEAAAISVTGVSLDLTTATITEGLTQQLTETVAPIDATDQSVAWSSDNNLIATVDASGLVTAVAVGTATITVTTTDGSFTATSVITVEAAAILVTGVSLDLPTATITEGLTQQLTETITPIDATDQSVAWSSDNLAVATVDASGLVTAVAVGTATITVTTTDGSFTATSVITVEAAAILVTGVSLDLTTATITEGLTQQLTETITPIDATDQSVAWSSDNNLIATVDASGLVTAVAVGTATITVTTTDGSFTATSVITVEAAPIAVTGVSLDLTTATITEGLTQQLTETVAPIDATDQSVAWSSDNLAVATVDASGLVTAVAVGTATITVTTTDGSFTATSIITVEAAPIAVTGVSLDLPTATITEGLTQQLTETITPIDATDQSVAWSSDNNLIATVDASGLVTAVAVGTATITVTTTDGSFTATSVITVEAAPIAVTGVSLDLTTATITEGLTQQLTETIAPIDATDQSVAWSSDNLAVATVDANGLVTAVAVGTATITVTTTDGSFTATSVITVEAAPILVTGVSLDLTTATITEGLTQQLTETITPIDATDQSVAWSSDNLAVATVDANGLVTAVAVGTATITVTTTDGSFTATSAITVNPPYNQLGKWSDPIQFGIIPVAVANLPDGRLMTWSSKYRDYYGGADGFTYTEIFDPFAGPDGTAMGEKVATTNHDMFCPGINNLPNGQILITGGSSNSKATLYDYSTDTWIATDNMNIPRGYHAGVTLADGSALIMGGSWSGGLAPNGEKITEIWRPGTGWRTLTGLRSDILFNENDLNFEDQGVYRADNHTWLWAAPNGKVFHAGPSEDMHWIDPSFNGSFTDAGKRADDTYSMKGTTVMFDIGKLLKVGGATSYSSGDPAKDNSYVIDINNENNVTVLPTQNNLSFSRTMHNSVVLPNGEVLVTGGISSAIIFTDQGARLGAEIYNPQTNSWRTAAGMQVPRTYHSVSILQADGRVFVGGGGLCGGCDSNHLDAEIYSPPYLFDPNGNLAQRPSIDAPEIADYNSNIIVNGSSGIQEFSLIRMSSSTHSTNNEQRRIPITFSGNGTYVLSIPDRNLLPPGYYMLFALDANGVPSIAEAVRVGVPTVFTSGVIFSPEVVYLATGEEQLLTATVIPSNADNTEVTMMSNDTSIATVDNNGLVTAISSGSTSITATTNDGNFIATASIVVDGGCTISNVAINGTAIQSSTYGSGIASLAIDGNTTGTNPWTVDADLQHTNNEVSPWWEVDLGSEYAIEDLRIFNRSNGFEGRLNNFYVFVSDTPFPSIATLESLREDDGIFEYYFQGTAGSQEDLGLNTVGRYIRIQLSGNGILHIAEVEVMGCFFQLSPCEGVLPVTLTPSGPYLDSDPIQTLEGVPTGGTWSGASTDGTFDPGIGPGTYSVIYTYDNGSGCIQSESMDLIVISSCAGVPPVMISSSSPYLTTDPIQTLVATPLGGTWSGASTDGTFDPGIGPGTYTVSYTYDNGSGCIQTVEEFIGVNVPCDESLLVTITQSGPYFDTDVIQTLDASPLGGTWSGASTDGTFDPSIGPGTYSVTYTFDNGLGCVESDTIDLVVTTPCDGVASVTIDPSGPYLDTDVVQTLVAAPAGGIWSGASTDGTFDPGIGAGTYSVTYTYDDGSGCIQSDTKDIVVNTTGTGGCILTNVALGGTATQSSTYGNGLASYAIDGNTTGTSPWSADLQHTNNEATPWWQLDLGAEYTIDEIQIFNRTDNFQSRLNNFYIFVSSNPFSPGATLAELTGDPTVFSYYFPGAAGLQETITLTTEGRYVRIELSGSGILHMAEVEVIGCLSGPSVCDDVPPVTIDPIGPFVETDPIQTLVGNPAGGTWSGASTDGTFDPGIGAGTYSVTYTYDNGLGCIQSDTKDIVVNTTGTGGCTLSNVALGGTATQSSTYGNGQASLAIDSNTTGTSPWSADLQHTNNEATPWWELDLGADYTIDNLNLFNRSDKLQSRLNNFYVLVSATPFAPGASLDDLRNDPTVFEYYFTGAAALQETIILSTQGRYVRVQLSGSGILHMAEVEVMGCFSGPSPCDGVASVTIDPSGPYLDTDTVQNLIGNPIGGTWSGASTDGTFDPGIGAGTYSVTYTYDNGLGCIQSDTKDIVVNTTGTGGCTLSNVALGGTATQSSTYGNGQASLAIDGNTTGTSPWSADLQHTNNEATPWWELDLGADYTIDNLNLFNRSDKLQSRLNNFYVFVSASPFSSGVSLADLIADTNITQYYFVGAAGLQETITLNAEGRYVRIQLSGSGILHMSEVEVTGCLITGPSLKAYIEPNGLDSLSPIFNIRLIPNPVTKIVDFEIAGEGDILEMIVYDLNGKQILRKEYQNSKSANNIGNLDVSHLANGVYQLYFKLNDGRVYTQKLIKN